MAGPRGNEPPGGGPRSARPWLVAGLVLLLAVPAAALLLAGPGTGVTGAPRALPPSVGDRAPVGPLASQALPGLGAPGSASPLGAAPVARPDTGIGATINLSSNRVESGLAVSRAVGDPFDLAYATDDSLLFVTGAATNSVASVDPQTGAVSVSGGPLPEKNDTGLQNRPSFAAYDPVNGQLFVSDPTLDQVSVYLTSGSGPGFSAGPTIDLANGSHPEGIAIDPTKNWVFVADQVNDSMTVINGSDDQVLTTLNYFEIPTLSGDPWSVVFDPATGLVWQAEQAIDEAGYFPATTAAVTPSGGYYVANDPTLIALDPTFDTIWVGSPRNICIIDGATQASSTNLTFPSDTTLTGLTWDSGLKDMIVSESIQVGNTLSGQIGVYSDGGGFVANVTVPGLPGLGAYSVAGAQTDLVDDVGNSILTIPDSTLSVSNRIPLGSYPGAISFNPITDRIEVPDNVSDHLIELNARATAPGDTPIPPGATLTVEDQPVASCFDPVNGQVVVAANPGLIEGINASTGARLETDNLGVTNELYSVLYANGQVFVTGGSNEVWALDPVTLDVNVTMTASLTGSAPRGMAYDPANKLLYVALYHTDQVQLFNTTFDVGAGKFSVGAGPYAIALDPGTGDLFVADALANEVQEMEPNGSILGSVGVGLYPDALTYVPAQAEVYVADERSNELTVLDAATRAVVGTIDVGEFPDAILFVNVTGDLYVSNGPDASLAVLTVATPSGAPFAATIRVSPASADAGLSVTFRVSASYPSWGFSYDYTMLPSNCTNANQSTITCHPSTIGPAQIATVEVANLAGDAVNVSTYVTVTSDPIVASFGPNVTAVTLGRPVTFSTTISGGTPPIQYSYPALPTGCKPVSGPEFNCTPTIPGNYTAEVTIYDSEGFASSKFATLTVNPTPLASLSESAGTIALGGRVTVSLRIQYGTAPFLLNWSGLPNGCAAPTGLTLNCTPTSAGTFVIRTTVTDASGYRETATIALNVTAPAASSGLSVLDEVGLGVVALLIVVVVAVLLLRRRSPGRAGAAEPAEPETPPEMIYGASSGPAIPRAPVESVAVRGPVSEPPPEGTPRYFEPAEEEGMAPPAAPTPAPTGGRRPPLKCPKCGAMNEPWLTNCRNCKRPLQST
jgi:YVTN family beta-propeller protein